MFLCKSFIHAHLFKSLCAEKTFVHYAHHHVCYLISATDSSARFSDEDLAKLPPFEENC